MTIDVIQIKKLREKSGAGISECREALFQNKGDLQKAESWLKTQGISKADKKSDRQTHQGLIASYVHAGGKIGVLVELACETDFVAKTDDFKNLAHEVALQISAMNPKNTTDLRKQAYIRDPQITISDLVKSTIAKLGENIKIKRFVRIALNE